MVDLSAMKTGQGVILGDGRLVRRAFDGTIQIDGDPDVGVTSLDDPAKVANYQRTHGLSVSGTMDTVTRAHIRKRLSESG